MAVFTEVTPQQLSTWLGRYDLGELVRLDGISEGIENTNYFVETTGGSRHFVLTLIEVIKVEQLPFYLGLMKHLAMRGVHCPEPMEARDGSLFGMLNGKPATLVTRLQGRPVMEPGVAHCHAIGELLARMHLGARDFPREGCTIPLNPRGIDWWPHARVQLAPLLQEPSRTLLLEEVEAQLEFARCPAWATLPRSPVHADLFRDNVLFAPDGSPGAIDFFFACDEHWMFDLAVTCNDWCMQPHRSGADANIAAVEDPERSRALLDGYRAVRQPTPDETKAWPMFLRAAALRFWLSRLFDLHFPRKAAMLKPKDPTHFERILRMRREQQEDGVQHGSQASGAHG